MKLRPFRLSRFCRGAEVLILSEGPATRRDGPSRSRIRPIGCFARPSNVSPQTQATITRTKSRVAPDRKDYARSMLPGEKSLFKLIGSLYEAIACPDRWQDFLRIAVEQFAAERAGLTIHTDQKNAAVTIQGIGFPAEATREYNAYYGARNPLVRPYAQLVAKTGAWHGLARSVVGERDYKISEYYNDFGRKYGTYWVVNALVRNSPHEVTTLSVMRSETAHPLDQQAVALMGLLMPHLRRVFKIRHTMESLRSTAAAAVSALDACEAAHGNGTATGARVGFAGSVSCSHGSGQGHAPGWRDAAEQRATSPSARFCDAVSFQRYAHRGCSLCSDFHQ